ncbi:MAG: hypothetical protein AAF493_00820 [Pseudomonadota bacterium]
MADAMRAGTKAGYRCRDCALELVLDIGTSTVAKCLIAINLLFLVTALSAPEPYRHPVFGAWVVFVAASTWFVVRHVPLKKAP